MDDILLVFVPQWSPFQPPLSLPSLAAWLRRAGYRVRCLDANIMLYNWLLSDDCSNFLLECLNSTTLKSAEVDGYRSILRSRHEFRKDIHALKGNGVCTNHKQLHVQRHYLAIKALSTYLEAVSSISGDFSISPYDFNIVAETQASSETLETFANEGPTILKTYVQWVLDNYIRPFPSLAIGLSCIGEEQLAFTLMFGRAMKRLRPNCPIFVGGTILPRIFERGVLKPDWFHRYFDIVVRNEGEKPCEMLLANLKQGLPLTRGVPGIIYSESGDIGFTEPVASLKPAEVPIPDFDDIQLSQYICSEITLPILSSRGCYWGKCEFCHHFMVYGDRYSSYGAPDTVKTIHELAQRYNVRHFAFNDEAIPPKIIASLGELLPDHERSGFTFTGLIKFEKFYQREHFANLARVGFRSLYVGLESASEHVLALMKKRASRLTILSNLRDATEAGIWIHCFLFFGFPGETEENARETYDFIMNNPNIIGSFGCGTFVLEHNAPIQRHPDLYKLEILEHRSNSDVSVYYDYSISDGITSKRALEWSKQLSKDSLTIEKYRATTWIPREFLLCLISYLTPGELLNESISIDRCRGIPPLAIVSELANLVPGDCSNEAFAVNRMRVNVALVRNKARQSLSLCMDHSVRAIELAEMDKQIAEWIAVTAAAPGESNLESDA
jgi:anaerobic magnesium-protoporphyrin IX monomethyl ester cyclase